MVYHRFSGIETGSDYVKRKGKQLGQEFTDDWNDTAIASTMKVSNKIIAQDKKTHTYSVSAIIYLKDLHPMFENMPIS